MADFTSSGWSVYIMLVTAIALVACFWLTMSLSKGRAPGEEVGTTGHKWDETLEEYNHPLPRWWIYLFYITIIFGIVYLALYPGFGSYKGSFGWTQVSQYEAEVKKADAQVAPLFEKYSKMEIQQIAADPQARAMGERMFLTYCVQCHGSDARGSKGFPNLTDGDWLHGGDPATIEKTILEGRNAMMPPMGAAIGGAADVENVANYVLSLSGGAHDAVKAELGKPKFVVCAACHGPDGKGMQAIGAPNLTDNIWLYGGSLATVTETINKGRINQMPSFKDLLGENKIRVLAAYVWGLSNTAPQKSAATQ
jgi:cytochrome c oxidase cbb3-type subunit 3